MDSNRNLRIVRTSDPSYPYPYKDNVLWVYHDENNNPVIKIWDHGKWVLFAGDGSGSGDITVDTELSEKSVNPVQNKAVKKAIDAKQDKGDYALKSEIPDITGLAKKSEIPDVSGLATKAEVNNKLDQPIIVDISANSVEVNCTELSGVLYSGSGVTALAISAAKTNSSQNGAEEVFQFSTGASSPTITITGVSWANSDVPTFDTYKTYEIHIMYNSTLDKFLATYATYE